MKKGTMEKIVEALDEAGIEHSDPVVIRSARCHDCELYGGYGFGPSHQGSPNCKCGSIASGGDKAHCTCRTCF